jgi:hypothetical protein
MRRWHARLGAASGVDEAQQVDDFYAFFVCCYHLKDWIKNDDAVPETVRREVESFVNHSPTLALLSDITNGFKHLKRDRPARVDAAARVSAIVNPSLGAFVLGESRLGGIVVLGDQGRQDAKQVADRCLKDWNDFLQSKGLVTNNG